MLHSSTTTEHYFTGILYYDTNIANFEHESRVKIRFVGAADNFAVQLN